jgi:hypothetical protein
MRDQLVDHVGGVLGRIGDQVDHARRQARVEQRVDDRSVRARANLGSLQHDRVRVGQWRRHRASGQDHGGVPRRDADDHPGGLPDPHRELAGHV